jgi:hypothetical protein
VHVDFDVDLLRRDSDHGERAGHGEHVARLGAHSAPVVRERCGFDTGVSYPAC